MEFYGCVVGVVRSVVGSYVGLVGVVEVVRV